MVVESGLEERRTPGNTLVVQSSKPYQVTQGCRILSHLRPADRARQHPSRAVVQWYQLTQVTGVCALLAVGPGSKRCRAEVRASLAACNTGANAAESCCTTITPLVVPCASPCYLKHAPAGGGRELPYHLNAAEAHELLAHTGVMSYHPRRCAAGLTMGRR